jgi:hypothetical protein
MWRIFKSKRAVNPCALPHPLQMEIVCGDCAGDEVYPRKTFLTSDGNCADCGGRSFVCAVRLFKMLKLHLLSINTEVNL